MRAAVYLFVALLITTSALAQDVPNTIPDRPDWSPDDVNRERLSERHKRHRGSLARMFAASHVSIMPFGQTMTADRVVQGGIQLPQGGSISVSFGRRTSHSPGLWDSGAAVPGLGTTYLMSFGYDLDARALLGPGRYANRASVGLGFGRMSGPTNALTAEINPRYNIYEGPFVSLPVGMRLTTAVASSGTERSGHMTFVGLSAGLRVSLARHDRLEKR